MFYYSDMNSEVAKQTNKHYGNFSTTGGKYKSEMQLA